MASREYRERLIDEVKKYPVLYDTRHEHHRDIDARDRCWTEIAARLGANSEVLKREWKILRDSLRQALKKTRGGATTKAGVPCKKWRFQARMAFVLPYMTRRSQLVPSARDDIKPDTEAESCEAGEGGAEAGEGGTEAGEAGECLPSSEPDALELFFASVCCSARRLPPPLQRALRRRVLDALLRAERRAADGAGAGLEPGRDLDLDLDPGPDSKPVLFDDL